MPRSARRREYIVHYATARPFAQYMLQAMLSEREIACLEEILAEKIADAENLHSIQIEEMGGAQAQSLGDVLSIIGDDTG